MFLQRSPLFLLAFAFLAASPAAQSTLLDFAGPPTGGWGGNCDVIGDWNGDGFGDLLVSAELEPNGTMQGAGSVSVYSGVDGSLLATLRGEDPGGHLGAAASAVGDVDGDGFADICVGSPDADVPGVGRNAGRARIFSGRDGSVLFSFAGSRNTEFFGTACAAAGDVDGDGHDDVLISAPSAVTPSGLFGGSVAVFSGADGHILTKVYGTRTGHRLGTEVCSVGDADADGVLDFAAVQYDTVRVFSGRDARQLQSRSYPHMGGSLVISGGLDANGDGHADYLVGTHMVNTFRGRAELISGRDGALLLEVDGDQQGDSLGFTVAAAGDLDGDGYGDFVTGIPRARDPGGNYRGAVRGFSGRDGRTIFTLFGSVIGGQLGWSLGAGRDVNGDGIPDVIACAVGTIRAQVFSFVPRGLEPYGTGTPGCAGKLTLLANGVPTIGNAGFELHLSGIGAPVTSLLLGDTPDVPGTLHYYARFHLAPGRILMRTPLPLPDSNRSLVFSLPIPNDPALLGTTTFLQAVSFFPEGICARRICSTPGLRLTFQ